MKLRSLVRSKTLNRIRLIRCKSQKSLERIEEKLIKMNKIVAVVDKRHLPDIASSEDVSNEDIAKLISVDMSRVDVLLILDEES
ncbi:hypothetical protein [Hydrogenobaculum acidophilum]